ncbi:unnamed protein product [Nyctereutes procyonoides]|uniref:(raccoon dog) hypothetical protein n=1 Tax=Nyctereutes procyonoides TaxID=34880 RepID=A0A811Z915_NYCPR|nr:unnamed protein product [Nyctereutes procyonoides]
MSYQYLSFFLLFCLMNTILFHCKTFQGHCRKSEVTEKPAFLSKKNPRQINWTSEEIQKKKTSCAVKFQRAITGASLADTMAKRNQKPAEAKKAKQATKKTTMAAAKAPPRAVSKHKILKLVKISAPRVGREC